MFSKHDSEDLKELFTQRPFQGQHPSQAKVIFFGRDANYPEDIENNETRPGCFDLLRQYHECGVGFWQNAYGNNPRQKHHPFLICMRHGDPGYKYHKVFSEMNLHSQCADHISFVELLNVPTMGDPKNDRRHEFLRLLSERQNHLQWLLEQLLLGDFRRVVFVPDNVLKPMNKVSVAPVFYRELSLRNTRIENECPLLIFKYGDIDVYKCYHFSDARGRGQLENMKRIIYDYI